jgi:hypothetical protein
MLAGARITCLRAAQSLKRHPTLAPGDPLSSAQAELASLGAAAATVSAALRSLVWPWADARGCLHRAMQIGISCVTSKPRCGRMSRLRDLRDLRGMSERSGPLSGNRTCRFAALSWPARVWDSRAGRARDPSGSRRSITPGSATKDADLQDVFYGSDGTRPRDLRRDRPVLVYPGWPGASGDLPREQGFSSVGLRGLPGAHEPTQTTGPVDVCILAAQPSATCRCSPVLPGTR